MTTQAFAKSAYAQACTPDDSVRAANALRERGFYRMPLALYDDVLATVDSDDARLGKGICLGKLGRFDEAREVLTPLFTRSDSRRRGEAYFAYVLERTGALDDALARYDRALGGPEGADAWTMGHRAYCLEKKGAIREARAAYAATLLRHPQDTWARKRYALFLWRRGEQADARAAIDSMRAATSEPPLAALNAIELAILFGDPEGTTFAFDAFERAQPGEAHRVVAAMFAWGAGMGEVDDASYGALLARAERLGTPVHRDFDDMESIVRVRGESVERWRALARALVK